VVRGRVVQRALAAHERIRGPRGGRRAARADAERELRGDTDGDIGAVGQKDVQRQITIMNLAFGGFYGGANTGFTFKLAGITRTDDAGWFYAGPGTREERELKQALTRDAPQALNYYSTTAGPYSAGRTCRG
jgi:hypothetical protein